MFAVASRQVHNPAGQMPETSFAGAVPRRSVGAAIRHGIVIGAAATVVQALILLVLLYATGIIGS